MDLLLASIAGIGWAGAVLTTRIAIDRSQIPDELGTFCTIFLAGVTSIILVFVTGSELQLDWSEIDGLAITGFVAPGFSQLSYFAAIRIIGPSRTGVVIGTAPVLAVLGAFLFTDGNLTVAIGIGTLLAVVGGGFLASEHTKDSVKLAGLGLAFFTALSFGSRDVITNEIVDNGNISPAMSSAVIWMAGLFPIFVYILARPERLKTNLKKVNKSYGYIALPGIISGLSMTIMLESFQRGDVEILSPLLNAVSSLSLIGAALLILGKSEWSTRVGISVGLVVIGAFLVANSS